ncbi:MAG: glycosyltransferase family 4 protein [Promethearchaeota archaeon]
MKVLMVVESHAKETGGGPKYWAQLSDWLTRHGHQVMILSGVVAGSEFASPNTVGLVPVRRELRSRSYSTVISRFAFMMRYIPAVRKFALNWLPDIIHTVPPIASEASLRTGNRLDIPVLVSVLSHVEEQWFQLESNPLRARFFRFLEARALHRPFSRIICLTQRSKQVLRAEGVPAERVVHIPHAVDVTRFNSNARPHFRKQLDLAKDTFVIGYAGALTREKGINQLLQAMVQLSYHSDVHLLIAGEISASNQRKQLLEVKGLENVTLLGPLEYDEMPSFMASLDLYVIPSFTETLPTTLLEALATGTPVMATDVGGVREVLQPSFGIILTRPDTYQISKELKNWINNRAELQNMGRAGQRYVNMYHTWERVGQLTEGVYRTCLRTK